MTALLFFKASAIWLIMVALAVANGVLRDLYLTPGIAQAAIHWQTMCYLHSQNAIVMSNDYKRIEKAIRYIRANVRTQPGLDEIASHVGLSPFHFQRLFRRWAGISPKRFLEYLTVAYAKNLLKNSTSVLDASYASGLTGAGRLHDQFVSIEAMTPGEFKQQGAGLKIDYGIHDSPFGNMLLAQTRRGVCAIAFLTEPVPEKAIGALRKQWPAAEMTEDATRTADVAGRIFNHASLQGGKIHLTVRGTNFQVNVWKALLRIPPGQIRSYQQVAAHLGKPSAHRAVATAIAANPIGFLIPCHRVLRSNGDAGEYHWGAARKQAMLAWEAALNAADNPDTGNIPGLAHRS